MSKEFLSKWRMCCILLQTLFAVIGDNCAMPSPHIVRRTNLLSLYSAFLIESAQAAPALSTHATDKAFAEKLAIANTSFSSYKTGARVIGDRVARQIEPRLGLPTGWMDKEHSQPAEHTSEEVQLARFLKLATRAFKRANDGTRKRLEDVLRDSLNHV